MHPKVTPEIIQMYKEQGVAHVPGAFSQDWIDEMAGVIEQAHQDAIRDGVSGKDVTPYMLARILDLTGGRSLETNIALIGNNARLAAEIAVSLTGA